MTSSPARSSRRAALVVGVLATLVSRQPVNGQQQGSGPVAMTLVSGDPVERTIAANEQQVFELPMEPGQAVTVTVDQAAADVTVTLRSSVTATPIVSDDEAKHHYGRERVVWLAPEPVRLEITVRAKSVIDGPHTFTLTAVVHEPSDTLTRAVRSLEDGVRLLGDKNPATLVDAATRLQQAVDAWREVGDREMVAETLYRLGRMQQRQLNRPADSVATLTAALAVFEELNQPDDIAKVLVLRADTKMSLSKIAESREDYEKALTYVSSLDPIVHAIVLDDIARVFQRTTEFDRAVEYNLKAIEMFRAAGARKDEAISLERLANAYQRMRRHDEALAALTEALALARQYASPTDIATMYASLGSLHQASGDDDAAVLSYREAIAAYPPEQPGKFGMIVSMARSLNRMGETQQARETLEQALAATPAQHKEYWAALADELGVTLTTQGEAARALELQRKAQEIVQAGQSRMGEMIVLRDMSPTYRALGDLEGARKALTRAMEIASTIPGRPYDGNMLREQARIERQSGDLAKARVLLDQAMDLAEAYRNQVQAQALRTSYGGNVGGYFEEAIAVAMDMHAKEPNAGHDGRAFELFERSLGRSLNELLSEARVDLRPGVDASLLAEQRRLQEQIGKKDTELRSGAVRGNEVERAAIERQIDDISRRLTILDGKIRTASPSYAAITRPATLSLSDAQKLLDPNTVLLAYFIGSKESWGWAITPTTVRGFTLPAAATIEARARKVYTDLTARQRRERPITGPQLADIDAALTVASAELSDMVLGPIAASLEGEWQGRRLAIVTTGALEYVPFAALPAPRVMLASSTRGGASNVPASATPAVAQASLTRGGASTESASTTAAQAGEASARPWLVDTHEIVRLPSMSALALLRTQSVTRPAASHTIAVLADPVYSTDDPRVRARVNSLTRRERDRDRDREGTPAASLVPSPASPAASAPVATLASAAIAPAATSMESLLRGTDESSTRGGFGRLVFSREEAQAIVKLAPAGEAFEALDFTASRETMASPAVARAGIIHIATHGILNSARPELSGLVLSLVDDRGQPQDGVLRLYDIFNLKLSADLVVLSGCQTGLGRQMNGEGLVGLTRGFMHAGVPRLVTSLWQVDDLATAELMRRFYRGLIVQQLSPAAALRLAQREMRATPRWQSPFYWAAFTLVGDWQQ